MGSIARFIKGDTRILGLDYSLYNFSKVLGDMFHALGWVGLDGSEMGSRMYHAFWPSKNPNPNPKTPNLQTLTP